MDINNEIKCTVDTCKYNRSAHCTLNCIQIGATKISPDEPFETECESFECSPNINIH